MEEVEEKRTLGVSWGRFSEALGRLGCFGGPLGAAWGLIGGLLGLLGASWKPRMAIGSERASKQHALTMLLCFLLGKLVRHLEPLGRQWGVLEHLGSHLGSHIEASWAILSHLGRHLGLSEALLELSWAENNF